MKVKKYWVIMASNWKHTIRKVYCAKSEKRAIDKFYRDLNNFYQSGDYVVESVKPLEINLEVEENVD